MNRIIYQGIEFSEPNEPKDRKQMNYKEGDRVRITEEHGGHEFAIGQIVTITETEDQDDPLSMKPESFRCDDKWWVNADEIELIVGICDCEKPLLPVYENGKRTGVTHSMEDEDYHLKYWSIEEIIKRAESN